LIYRGGKMNLSILILIVMSLVSPSSAAHADYQDLKNDFETYAPPPYFESRTRSAPVPADAELPQDTDFETEKKRIREMKTLWERSLSITGKETSYVRIHSARLKKLRPAASDDKLAIARVRRKFSLADLEALVLLRNPGIRAEENRLRAAAETFSQISELDEILRKYTAYTEALMPGVGPMKGKDPVKMKFPFPGILALKGQIVNQEVKAVHENVEVARRKAVTAARKAYWNLVFVRKSRKITGETLKHFRQLETVATTRYKSGTTSFQDVIKAEIRREILEEDLRTLREKQRNIEAKILELLNLPPGVQLGNPKDRKPAGKKISLKSLYPLARENRQELRRMRAMIGKMERMVEMAETMILPPYTLNLSLYEDEAVMKTGSAAMKESFPVSTSASRGAGLPKMPWYGTQDAYLRQTRQKLRALREDLRRAEAMTATMVRNAWSELDRARREAALYGNTLIDLSRSALDVSTRGYESGTVSFADVTGSYTNWLRVRLTLDRKRSDIGIALADLEEAVGTALK